MARFLAAAGFRTVHCTPHLISGVYAAGSEAVRTGVEALQRRLDHEGIDLRLKPGREYYLDEFLLSNLDDPLLVGDTGLLLIEFSSQATEDLVKSTLFRVVQKGFTPLIAHPERCRLLEPKEVTTNKGFWSSLFNSKLKTQNSQLTNENSKLSNPLFSYLQEIGCQFQGNLGSFAGHYGERVRRNAQRLQDMGLYSYYGTDGHSVEGLKASVIRGPQDNPLKD